MTHAEALAELIADVDQHLDNMVKTLDGTGLMVEHENLEATLAAAKTSLRYHCPHEHCFDRTNNERKDDL